MEAAVAAANQPTLHRERERDSAQIPEQQRIMRDYRMIRMFYLTGLTQNVRIKVSWVHFGAMMKGVDFPMTNKAKSKNTEVFQRFCTFVLCNTMIYIYACMQFKHSLECICSTPKGVSCQEFLWHRFPGSFTSSLPCRAVL